MPKKAKPSEYIPVPPSPTQNFLTVKNVAAYLGTTVSFVRHQLVYAKAVPYTQLGARIIFAKADLDSYMAKRIAA